MANLIKFSITYDHLPCLVGQVSNYMLCDSIELTEFGYTLEKSEELKQEVKKFESIPLDNEFKGNQAIATEKTNKTAEEIGDLLGTVLVGIKATFGTKDLSRLSDESLLAGARYVAKTSTIYLEEIKDKGLTDEIIKKLIDLSDAFESAIHAQYIPGSVRGTLLQLDNYIQETLEYIIKDY